MPEELNEALKTLAQAIGEGLCVKAIYNRGAITLAPESLVDKHGQLYVSAVRVEYDGRRPLQPKLGTFKLSGLTELRLSSTPCSARQILETAALPAL